MSYQDSKTSCHQLSCQVSLYLQVTNAPSLLSFCNATSLRLYRRGSWSSVELGWTWWNDVQPRPYAFVGAVASWWDGASDRPLLPKGQESSSDAFLHVAKQDGGMTDEISVQKGRFDILRAGEMQPRPRRQKPGKPWGQQSASHMA